MAVTVVAEDRIAVFEVTAFFRFTAASWYGNRFARGASDDYKE